MQYSNVYLFFSFQGAEFDKKLSIPAGHQHSGTETEAQWNQPVSHQVRTRERLGFTLPVFSEPSHGTKSLCLKCVSLIEKTSVLVKVTAQYKTNATEKEKLPNCCLHLTVSEMGFSQQETLVLVKGIAVYQTHVTSPQAPHRSPESHPVQNVFISVRKHQYW